MAMLAGPRRKQKLSVDPNNLNWSNDDSKFGQRMLEQMGWQKGRGLGAKEDGKVDHITVQVKNDSHGVGCSKKHADNWIAHQDDFNSLLANLNQGHSGSGNNTPDSERVISLENHSKSSKGRVHYKKFTRGKDLSGKNSEDLNCIFGRRKSKVKSDEEPKEKAEDSSSNEQTSHELQSGVVTMISKQSVQEYFAQKMAQLKRMQEGGNASSPAREGGDENQESDSVESGENAEQVIFSTKNNGEMEKDNEHVEDNELESQRVSKKKKKKLKVKDTETVSENCNVENDKQTVVSASKKRNKRKLETVSEDGEDESGDQSEVCSSKKKKGKRKKVKGVSENCDVVEDVRVSKKKKGKAKESENDSEICDVVQSINEPVSKKKKEKVVPSKKKKGKKGKEKVCVEVLVGSKKKKKVSFDESVCNGLSDKIEECNMENDGAVVTEKPELSEKSSGKGKKRKRKASVDATDDLNGESTTRKSKKKKRASSHENEGGSTEKCDENDKVGETGSVCDETEKSEKKKRKVSFDSNVDVRILKKDKLSKKLKKKKNDKNENVISESQTGDSGIKNKKVASGGKGKNKKGKNKGQSRQGVELLAVKKIEEEPIEGSPPCLTINQYKGPRPEFTHKRSGTVIPFERIGWQEFEGANVLGVEGYKPM